MKLGFELEADEVVPNLWQGSKPRLLSAAEAGFHTVILCAPEACEGNTHLEFMKHGLKVVEAPFDDTLDPTLDHYKTAHWAADRVVEAHKRGDRVLVTCWQGWNRSGLVNAIALRELHRLSGFEAAKHVQSRRSDALCNNVFFEYLKKLG